MNLNDKRVLITQADRFMGPPIAERFRAAGADVIANTNELTDDGSAQQVAKEAGRVDILIANFAEPPRGAPVGEIADSDWHRLFDCMVHPLMRIVRAVMPQMIERRSGKVVGIGSSAPLEGLPRFSGYCAARGAQNAFLKAVALEVARHNVQVNVIAQNYVANNVYYPPGLLDDAAKRAKIESKIPSRRIAEPNETAELALFLSSDAARHLVGQILPFAGGAV